MLTFFTHFDCNSLKLYQNVKYSQCETYRKKTKHIYYFRHDFSIRLTAIVTRHSTKLTQTN
jgi:hypothetical protein